MPTRTYSRKNGPSGLPGDPAKGEPSFLSGAATALPGRTWRCAANGSDVTLRIDGDELTQDEIDELDAAHTAWSPTSQVAYSAIYQVTTTDKGNVTKIEWFETDNGDGTYSGLAAAEEYTWQPGSKLVSVTRTRYAKDGTVLGHPTTDSYYTTSSGERVKKVTYG